MISKKVKVYERQDFQKEKLESVWCNIYSKSGNFVLGSVYILPNDSKSMKVLIKVIDRLRLESLPIIIVGDSMLIIHTGLIKVQTNLVMNSLNT